MELSTRMQMGRLHACKKEPETVKWIEDSVRPGEVLYDVGANVGAYSFIAYQVTGGDCLVYAFEPSFSTFAALCQNIFLNKCETKIVPLPLALAECTGILNMQVHNLTAGAAEHRLLQLQAPGLFAGTMVNPVLSYRLDELVSEFGLRPPNHMKIDVDGGELRVLRGADITLKQANLRSILVEIDEDIYPNGEIQLMLESNGFHCVSRHQRGERARLANCVFVR